MNVDISRINAGELFDHLSDVRLLENDSDPRSSIHFCGRVRPSAADKPILLLSSGYFMQEWNKWRNNSKTEFRVLSNVTGNTREVFAIIAQSDKTDNGDKAFRRHSNFPKLDILFIAVFTVPLNIIFVLICANSNYKRNARRTAIFPLPARSVFVLRPHQTHRRNKYTRHSQGCVPWLLTLDLTETAEHQTVSNALAEDVQDRPSCFLISAGSFTLRLPLLLWKRTTEIKKTLTPHCDKSCKQRTDRFMHSAVRLPIDGMDEARILPRKEPPGVSWKNRILHEQIRYQ